MRRAFVIICLLFGITISLIIYLNFSQNHKFETIFFNIGQGDSALVRFSNGEKMLIDCGPDKNILAKLGKFLPLYDRTIDYLVISHFDLDHYGGCVDVLKRYQVRNIITNDSFKDDSYWQSWDETRKLEQANEFVVANTSSWKMGDSQVEFLWPDKSKMNLVNPSDENDKSIVLRISNSSTSILFTGDLGINSEKELINIYCGTNNSCSQLSSKILKAGHHGSDTSSSDEWLQAVNPQTSIISVGKNNFGHPSLRVLRKMERSKIKILQTRYSGDILL